MTGEYGSLIYDIEEQFDRAEERETPIISPVEQMFLIEWHIRRHWADQSDPSDRFDLRPQYQNEKLTGKYRLDFSIDFLTGIINCPSDSIYFKREEATVKAVPEPLLGIEIDGHEWHERTKEQARRDKERERFLVAKGWKILRFTGSEVFKKPGECVTEVVECATKLASDWHRQLRSHLKGRA
jgi:hypothetical protein